MAEAAERGRKSPREGHASPSAAAVEPQHKYQRIADALKVKDVPVSLLAAVSEIGAAVKSRGSDFTRTLRIVDESRPAGVSAIFFAEDTARLPCVKSSGDVISLHEVMIMMHGEYLVITFKKKCSSFALFQGKIFGECSPYQTSVKYHGTEHDRELLIQTRTWFATNPTGLKDLELRLRSLKSDSTFDLVCKVLHVHEDSGTWIFYVWDGTDTPAAEFQMFCNMTCKQEFGIWKGILLDSSRVRLLSHEDGSVIDRLKMYDSRNANQVHRQPMTSSPEASNVTVLSDVEYDRAAYTTLMRSLTYNEVVHKLKTLVRVVAACPCQASELGLLEVGSFCVRLTLEDPTARIHAYVHKNYAVKFFGGFLAAEDLIKKMNKLLGVPEDSEEGGPLTRNPPWIWCGLKSYYLDEKNPWGSRRYQISGTKMRG